MRIAYPSLRVSTRVTLTFFLALVVGAIALLSLGTRPAETKPTTAKPLYKVQDLGTLGGSSSFANDINDAGKVVGYSDTSDGYGHAFLWADDGDSDPTDDMKDLGTLGSSYSLANGINDKDQVVGYSTTRRDAEEHLFLYSGGKMKDLTSLISPTSGWKVMDALAINDNGYIVGWGINQAGQQHALLLIPPQKGGQGPG